LWLLFSPKIWLYMSQSLRERLRYMAPQMSKKQPFAPFVLAGALLTMACLR
jgi:prepilin peptidase CpaA